METKLKEFLRNQISVNAEMNTLIDKLVSDLETKYPVDLSIYYNKFAQGIILSRIIVAKKANGVGTKVMNEICNFADKLNLPIYLTPTSDYGSSIERLQEFYSRFGFKKYKGYKVNERMIREPNF